MRSETFTISLSNDWKLVAQKKRKHRGRCIYLARSITTVTGIGITWENICIIKK